MDADDILEEARRRVARTVWCTLATADAAGRPTTRIVHPVWAGDVVWLATRTGTPKLRHLERTPAVSLLWWDPHHEQVNVDGHATVHDDDATRAEAWEVFRAPAEPYGWDPATIWPDGPTSGACTIVRIRPTKVTLFGREPAVWRAAGPGARPPARAGR